MCIHIYTHIYTHIYVYTHVSLITVTAIAISIQLSILILNHIKGTIMGALSFWAEMMNDVKPVYKTIVS